MTTDVSGFEMLLQKKSAVNKNGDFQQEPIHGVCFRPIRPVAHEDEGVLLKLRVKVGEK